MMRGRVMTPGKGVSGRGGDPVTEKRLPLTGRIVQHSEAWGLLEEILVDGLREYLQAEGDGKAS